MKQKKKNELKLYIHNANLRVSKDTVVCALHWPSGFEEIKVNGKSRPKYPPSPPRFSQVYHLVKYQHKPPPPKPTKKACSSTQSIEEDQLLEFLSSDKVRFTSLKENLKNQGESLVHLSCFVIENTLYVQSQQYLNGVPLFLKLKFSRI